MLSVEGFPNHGKDKPLCSDDDEENLHDFPLMEADLQVNNTNNNDTTTTMMLLLYLFITTIFVHFILPS